MKHTCHVPGCGAACPPRHLTCASCWRIVPKKLQAEVYRTIRLRGKVLDETWAAWWRAQAQAIAHVLREKFGWPEERVTKFLEREEQAAARFEDRAKARAKEISP